MPTLFRTVIALVVAFGCVLFVLPACASHPDKTIPDEGATELEPTSEHSLTAESSPVEIASHLDWAESNHVQTRELSRHFPDMSWEEAYAIQRVRFDQRQATDPIAGWKIGWSAQPDPSVPLEPAFGPVAESLVFSPAEPLSTSRFVNGSSGVEAEIVFWLKDDLPKPSIGVLDRDTVARAVHGVGAAIEFVNARVGPFEEHGADTRAHGVADNVYAAGVVLPEKSTALEAVDWAEVVGSISLRGKLKAESPSTVIMGKDPLEAMVWIANEVHKHGHELKAGQFVVTGTVVTPVGARAGDKLTVAFRGLGEVSIELVDGEGDQ